MKQVEVMGQFLGPDPLHLVQIRRYSRNQILIDKSPGSQRGGLELIIHYWNQCWHMPNQPYWKRYHGVTKRFLKYLLQMSNFIMRIGKWILLVYKIWMKLKVTFSFDQSWKIIWIVIFSGLIHLWNTMLIKIIIKKIIKRKFNCYPINDCYPNFISLYFNCN